MLASINAFMLHHVITPQDSWSLCDEVSTLNPLYILFTKECELVPGLLCPSGYDEKDPGNCASSGYSVNIGNDFYHNYAWAKPPTSDKQVVYSFVRPVKQPGSYIFSISYCKDCCE